MPHTLANDLMATGLCPYAGQRPMTINIQPQAHTRRMAALAAESEARAVAACEAAEGRVRAAEEEAAAERRRRERLELEAKEWRHQVNVFLECCGGGGCGCH